MRHASAKPTPKRQTSDLSDFDSEAYRKDMELRSEIMTEKLADIRKKYEQMKMLHTEVVKQLEQGGLESKLVKAQLKVEELRGQIGKLKVQREEALEEIERLRASQAASATRRSVEKPTGQRPSFEDEERLEEKLTEVQSVHQARLIAEAEANSRVIEKLQEKL